MQRTHWDELPDGVRKIVESNVGPVLRAETVSAGNNSEVAAFLETAVGKVFIKGLRSDHPRVWTQKREAMVNPYVLQVAPRLLWKLTTDGWDLLCFEHVAGHHADFSPGSADLPKVVHAMNLLAEIRCPDLPIRRSEQRWASYVDDESAALLLRGDRLLHTDYNPLNILISADGEAWIVDWAWPTRGAAWIDPACFALRLMAAGHDPEGAEDWASRVAAWKAASQAAIDTFAIASVRMWDEIATDHPQPWKLRMGAVVREWLAYRCLQSG